MASEAFKKELLVFLFETLNVSDPIPPDYPTDAPLLGPDSPMGFDSLDAVEIVVSVEKKYGVKIGGETSGRVVLTSLDTLADFIEAERAKAD